LAEAMEFTARVTSQAVGRPVRVYPVSSRAALTARGDPGFAAFAAGFSAYLESGLVADLRLSVASHARRAGAQIDAVLAGEMRSAPAGQTERPCGRLRPTKAALQRGRLRSATPGTGR
jgi:hypothetical protein